MAKRPRRNMRDKAMRQAEILDSVFFEENENVIWDRERNPGYIAIPRVLPLAMQAIDHRTKGKPAGHVYFCLWVRAPDYSLVTIDSPQVFAFEAGFSGERAVDTWKKRISSLRDLGFIKTYPGPVGEFSYIVLFDPIAILTKLWNNEQIQKDLYMRVNNRAMEIGADETITLFEKKKKANESSSA